MLIVADVGQNLVEEIDIVRKGGNYGWRIKEGDFLFDPEGLAIGVPLEDPNLKDPVAQYDHDDGLSVIGGYMYYGALAPELLALYVFEDFSQGFTTPNGRLFVADLLTGRIEELLLDADRHVLGLFVKGFGQDRDGEIYVGQYGTRSLRRHGLGPETGCVTLIGERPIS